MKSGIPKPLLIMLPAGAAVLMSLPSCNGMFAGIYDSPGIETDYGFINVDKANSSGTVYIDAVSYTKWTYIDFDTYTIDTASAAADGTDAGSVDDGWDLAVHRYDAKTNSGSVAETEFGTLDDFMASGKLPEDGWVEDVWTEDRIAIDMSGMMDGIILYAPSYYNPELSKWMEVDTSVMPPLYRMSGKVYVIVNSEGKAAAVRLSDYMDGNKTKGYLTIDYVYPVEF